MEDTCNILQTLTDSFSGRSNQGPSTCTLRSKENDGTAAAKIPRCLLVLIFREIDKHRDTHGLSSNELLQRCRFVLCKNERENFQLLQPELDELGIVTDSCQSSRLTYEALPSTLVLDPALLSLAGQSYTGASTTVTCWERGMAYTKVPMLQPENWLVGWDGKTITQRKIMLLLNQP
ncbi:hypothetical protein EYF80_019272 [Liparis tanakae]|uniref:Uncharacterized protein n=1 Tax=Liparis tanakae TaxID=230148 RepID=A0A4Z2HXW1_9TELE|nr:hypothetical protein EYF80_019272 [Liparis tanakae]